MINPTFISHYLLKTFNDLNTVNAWGEISFFYNPRNQKPRGTYFCTIKEHDGENDKASALHRKDTFRLSFGISKPSFLRLFGSIPRRPSKGHTIQGLYDFTQLDTLYPHPIYGWMCWVAIINPSEHSFKQLEKTLHESYGLVLQKHRKKGPTALRPLWYSRAAC
jgi:hypothetical protein